MINLKFIIISFHSVSLIIQILSLSLSLYIYIYMVNMDMLNMRAISFIKDEPRSIRQIHRGEG